MSIDHREIGRVVAYRSSTRVVYGADPRTHPEVPWGAVVEQRAQLVREDHEQGAHQRAERRDQHARRLGRRRRPREGGGQAERGQGEQQVFRTTWRRPIGAVDAEAGAGRLALRCGANGRFRW